MLSAAVVIVLIQQASAQDTNFNFGQYQSNRCKRMEANNNLTLDEILTQHLKIRSNDKYIDHKIIDAEEKVMNALTSGSFDDKEIPDMVLLVQVESIEDPLIYQLTHLVLRSNKVRIETINEIEEAELEDPVLPNKLIFHKDAPRRDVIGYSVSI